MIKELIVVEGKSDTAAIRRAVDAETIETGGSAIGRDVLERIRLAKERRGVIIFTDPDHAGERIRHMIQTAVPGCKHAFLTREDARGRRNLGVENASPETIRRALERMWTEAPEAKEEISWTDLMELGLLTHSGAAERRRHMGQLLHIGMCNGKQFYKRCRMLQISREEFLNAYERMEREWNGGNPDETEGERCHTP